VLREAVACALLLILPELARAEEASSARAMVEMAARARAEGHLEEALALLERAYGEHASSTILHNKARVLEELGRYSSAAETYERIIADPSTLPQIRDEDRARLAALTPKLGRAWLLCKPTLSDGELWIDGERMRCDETTEASLAPGQHRLEICAAESGVLHVAVIALPAGASRALVIAELTQTEGEIALDRLPLRFRSLTIDGREVVVGLGLHSVRVAPGMHEIAWVGAGGEAGRARIEVARGETKAVERDVAVLPASELSAVHESASWSAIGPGLLGGGGLAMGVVAAILFATAASDRSKVTDAEHGSGGAITGLTMAEASRLESSANTRNDVAVVLSIAGALALGSAAAWWFLELSD
jgi:hypothetical protein